ncbi:MAG: DUF308 domain-containing protein [Rubrivivax sp.]|nr:DUF308 domain-containing protein [Rubrivivax sp.]MCL4699762.1 DUF308 domain-containing protein [Burkholderiaceae bacterium]
MAAAAAWSGSWRAMALRAAAAVVFAVLAYVWPGPTLLALAELWGVYALLDGIVLLAEAVRLWRRGEPAWLPAGMGLVGAGAGLAALMWPPIAAISLIALVGGWAVVLGVAQLGIALRLRRALHGGEWLLALAGVASLALAVLVVANARSGVLVMMWMLAAHALTIGAVLGALAWRLRRLNAEAPVPTPAPAPAPRRAFEAEVAEEAREAAREAAAIVGQ